MMMRIFFFNCHDYTVAQKQLSPSTRMSACLAIVTSGAVLAVPLSHWGAACRGHGFWSRRPLCILPTWVLASTVVAHRPDCDIVCVLYVCTDVAVHVCVLSLSLSVCVYRIPLSWLSVSCSYVLACVISIKVLFKALIIVIDISRVSVCQWMLSKHLTMTKDW